MSLSYIHLCWVFLSSPFFVFPHLFFSPLIHLSQTPQAVAVGVTGRARARIPSEIDRRVGKAHCCSGHVRRSTALQQPHIASLPLRHPCEEALSHSFASKLLFLQCSCSLESWGVAGALKISVPAALERVPPLLPAKYWFDLENPAGSPAATLVVARRQRTSQPIPQNVIICLSHSVNLCFWGGTLRL